MKEKPPLSVALISYNEEENIARALGSVGEIAGEMVVVDSNSTDRTVDIAMDCGARVFNEDWKGFRDQKNSALAKCTSEWILCIDCDEVVSNELRDSISNAMRDKGQSGYYLRRKTYYAGRLLRFSWQPDKKLRLVRRSANPCWKGDLVHEYLSVDGGTGNLAGPLYHYSYRDISAHFQRTVKYARLSAESYVMQGKRFHIHNLLLNPVLKMIRRYFLQLGFLDGVAGLTAAFSTMVFTFLKYVFIWEIERAGPAGKGRSGAGR